MTGERPEPNGWELLEAINNIRTELRSFVNGAVTTTTLALVQKSWEDRDAAKGREIGDLRSEIRRLDSEHGDAEKRTQAREDDQRRQRTQLWIGISAVAIPAIASLVFALLTHFRTN